VLPVRLDKMAQQDQREPKVRRGQKVFKVTPVLQELKVLQDKMVQQDQQERLALPALQVLQAQLAHKV
jgi:hypothetical protein